MRRTVLWHHGHTTALDFLAGDGAMPGATLRSCLNLAPRHEMRLPRATARQHRHVSAHGQRGSAAGSNPGCFVAWLVARRTGSYGLSKPVFTFGTFRSRPWLASCKEQEPTGLAPVQTSVKIYDKQQSNYYRSARMQLSAQPGAVLSAHPELPGIAHSQLHAAAFRFAKREDGSPDVAAAQMLQQRSEPRRIEAGGLRGSRMG